MAGATLALAVLAGCGGSTTTVTQAAATPSGGARAQVAPVSSTRAPPTSAPLAVAPRSGHNVNDHVAAGAPTWIDIPSLGVHSGLVPLGLERDGTAQVPTDPAVAGWFTGGPHPGDPGPSVIVGHVDSTTGPAVFFKLRELTPGSVVTVSSSTGQVPFRVDRVAQVSKDRFPTAAIYGPVPDRELRLVTCGGVFNRGTGHYADNVVVFLTASGPAL